MSLTAKIVAHIEAVQTNNPDLGVGAVEIDAFRRIALEDGTATDKADRMFTDERTLNTTSENLDLAGGSLIDAFGAGLTFVKVKAIMVIANASNPANIQVGGAASNGFVGPFADATDKIVVKPGGVFLWACPGAGAAVTASTGDILKVENLGTGSYKIVIIGTSA